MYGGLPGGSMFAHYRIMSLLGKGGMGEVYLAGDTRLDRKVALKLLPVQFSRDEERLRRFILEAKAASSLNHPNILTIFEIGEVDGRAFMAAEFVDGQTLRAKLREGRLSLREALDIAIQAAGALAAAHAANIVHRDIKPENIMLRHDGYVKILDFGLAKVTEQETPPTSTRAETVAELVTSPGTVMGTAQYMSPEQARGVRVDARSDIFSLGAVLYELLAGHPAFEGPTPSHLIISIIEKDPPSIAPAVAEEAVEVERIISKALVKDREERYQTVKDLAIDLKQLRRRLDSASERIRVTSASGASAVDTAPIPAKRKSNLAAIEVMGIVLAAATIFAYWWFDLRASSPAFQDMRITRLTNTGKISDAAISPDGRYVVYVVNDGGQRSLWMRQVATGSNVQIVPPSDVGYHGLTFSHDGDFLYFVMSGRQGIPTLYQMPALGGTARKLITNVEGTISLSPDGRRLAFLRGAFSGVARLMIANSDGTGERQLLEHKLPDFLGGPAWSPDGKTIAYVLGTFTGGYHSTLMAISPDGGGAGRLISNQTWYSVARIAWLSGNRGLIVVGVDHPSFSGTQIWQLGYPRGVLRRITNDVNTYLSVSLTSDTSHMVTVQLEQISNIWVAPDGDAVRARQVTSGSAKSDANDGIDWTPDGRIVYASAASGVHDLWIMDADGSNTRELTINSRINVEPSVSPDGRYIAFVSDRAGNPQIWRMDSDGGNLRLLGGNGAVRPSVSADGKSVAYCELASGHPTVLQVSIDGGASVRLTDKLSCEPAASPDGKLVAMTCSDDPDGQKWHLCLIPAGGGAAVKTLEFPDQNQRAVQWTRDGTAVDYVDTRKGVSNIWRQPIAGGPARQITNFASDRIYSFAWSRDGKRLAVGRGVANRDVVLISGGK